MDVGIPAPTNRPRGAPATPSVDAAALAEALDEGRGRAALAEHTRAAASDAVLCSPHVCLTDGTDYPNPGLRVNRLGDWGVGFPVIEHDDPTMCEDILRRSIP